MAARNSNAKEAAAAVNDLLHLDEADQGALMEVIEAYFILPSEMDVHSDEEEGDDGPDINDRGFQVIYVHT